MEFKIEYERNQDLPKLGWIARVDMDSMHIHAAHGLSVECRDEWMVEGVWDGTFEEGNFHRSENFFGSGFRIEGDKLYFVTSSSPVDRILFCRYRDRYVFSNSLILLLGYTGAQLDSSHDYQKESSSICNGVNEYEKEYTIIHPEIRCFYQVFIENTILSPTGVSFENRMRHHEIASYDQYYGMVTDVLKKFRQNYASNTREIEVSAFTTTTSGYDSVAVSCLVRSLGVNQCFSGDRINVPLNFVVRDQESKAAKRIADRLGYDVIHLKNRRSSISEDELFFFATNYPKHNTNAWSEVSLHSMVKYIESNSSAAVLFSGHHGDIVWDVNVDEAYLGKEMKRPIMMGFCQEMRLKSGFYIVPVPWVSAMSIEDIVAISKSPEMKPWRLFNQYDRPIPRRIGESAGLERRMFGMKKEFIALGKYLWPINRNLRRDFFKHLKAAYGIYPFMVYLEYAIQIVLRSSAIEKKLDRIGLSIKKGRNLLIDKDVDLYFSMCHWAIQILAGRMSRVIGDFDEN